MLTVTQMLRKKGVVNKFVEFYGAGLDELPLADRATIANMAPEYGATCGFFPIDAETIRFLKRHRPRARPSMALVEAYAKKQGLWRTARRSPDPIFTDTLRLDLGDVEPSMAGPARPQDRVPLEGRARAVRGRHRLPRDVRQGGREGEGYRRWTGADYDARPWRRGDRRDHLVHQHVQPLRSCWAPAWWRGTRSKLGLKVKPWVKTSLAPGSQVVTEYLARGRACRRS